ncbi:sex peptide receptor-related protein 2-like [Tachypleus tridentatus]|uniref:sex peptide receptor-related protein 2-like n=1 Tax=Tachypleus tridentatus TaxID=6853 RepID=UPI003FD0881C
MRIDENNRIRLSQFGKRPIYLTLHWIRVVVFALLPAVIIVMSNTVLIHAMRHVQKIRRKLLVQRHLAADRRHGEQIKLSITLVAITCLFLIGELPSNLVSRITAVHLLFGGDACMLHSSLYRILALAFSVLVTTHYSSNFVFYCAFNKKFIRVLRRIHLFSKTSVVHQDIFHTSASMNRP